MAPYLAPINHTVVRTPFHLSKIASVITLLALCLGLTGCLSRSGSDQASFFNLLQSDGIQEVALELDLSAVRAKSDEPQAGTLRWQHPCGRAYAIPVEVSTRGNSRRTYCNFPPLKLDLGEGQVVQGRPLIPESYKLVSHCLDSDADEQLVLKEFLAYRLYEELTPISFRTHLLKITYRDANGQEERHWAILLEDKNELAERLDARLLAGDASVQTVAADEYSLFTVFQYMIGNTDWNLGRRHNLKFIRTQDSSLPVPVPYDFDFSGLVDAPYAKPHPDLPIHDVQQRFFQWRGRDRAQLKPVLEYLAGKKGALLDRIETVPGLQAKEKNRARAYLESFFQTMDQLLEHDVRMVESLPLDHSDLS